MQNEFYVFFVLRPNMRTNFASSILFTLNWIIFSFSQQQIEGELYRVDQRKFDFLDEFEEYPQFYTREQIEVTSRTNERQDIHHHPSNVQEEQEEARGIKKWTAWVYLLSNFKPYLLTLPFYSNYDSFGPHNLPFVVRSKRPPNDPHGLAKRQVKE